MIINLLGAKCFCCCSGSNENYMLSALTSYKSKIGGASVDIAIC